MSRGLDYDRLPPYIRYEVSKYLGGGVAWFEDDRPLRIFSVVPVIVKINERNNFNEPPTLYYKGIAITSRDLLQFTAPKFPLHITELTLETTTIPLRYFRRSAFTLSNEECRKALFGIEFNRGEVIFELNREFDDDVLKELKQLDSSS